MLFNPSICISHSDFQLRNLRFSIYLVFCITLLLSVNAQAINPTAVGPGGGGWLYAGAFNPANADEMLIGTDMCGVFRTTDGGDSWGPWNAGLLSDRPNAMDQISYVQDLMVIRYENNPVEYYAATLGGIFFKANESGLWTRDTGGMNYNYIKRYYDNGVVTPIPVNNVSIPFSCLAYNGDGVLYAGAGANRTGWAHPENWFGSDLEQYPGLDDSTDPIDPYIYGNFVSSSVGNYQYTVWKKNINGTGWLPIEETADMGTARDISVARIGSVDYIVVCTIKGIWLYNGEEWINLCDSTMPLYDNVYNSNNTVSPHYNYYRTNLLCWNVYLTKRGTLYAGMHVHHAADNVIPGGVYRMFVTATSPDESFRWFWVGNDDPINNGYTGAPVELCRSMAAIGLATRHVTYNPFIDPNTPYDFITGATIWLMNVIEGANDDPDIILAGSRGNSLYSMVRNIQPHRRQDDEESHAPWSSRVYKDSLGAHMFGSVYGQAPEALNVGHEEFWGTELIFQPVVLGHSSLPIMPPVLVQFNSMLHRSDDAGTTWANIYCDGAPGMWSGRGYDEMQIHDLDFHVNGNVIEAVQDNGIYSSTNLLQDEWLRENIPVIAGVTYQCGTGIEAWSEGSSEQLMATVGLYGSNDELVMKLPDGSWEDVPFSVQGHSVVGIHDFELISQSVCFVAYSYFTSPAETQKAYGVSRGINSGGNNWTWTPINSSPILTLAINEILQTGCTMDLEYMPEIDRLFCSIGISPNIYMLLSSTDNTWVTLPKPWGSSLTYSGYNIYEMASSSINNRHTLMFGMSKEDPTYTDPSVVFRTENAEDIPDNIIWQEFPLSAELSANDAHQIKTIAISPYDDRVAYLGINVKGASIKGSINIGNLHKYNGLWRLNISDIPEPWVHEWTYEFDGTMANGIIVEDLAFNTNETKTGQLVIATGGQGLYITQIPPPPAPPEVTYKYTDSSSSVPIAYLGMPYSSIPLDYDNDGRNDIFITSQDNIPTIHNNTGTTNGQPVFAMSNVLVFPGFDFPLATRGSAAGDFNHDGELDLYVAHPASGDSSPLLFKQTINGVNREMHNVSVAYGLTTTLGSDAWAGSWNDFNGDGYLDLYISRAENTPPVGGNPETPDKMSLSRPDRLLLNSSYGRGPFADLMQAFPGIVQEKPSYASAWADFDLDGDLDGFVPSSAIDGDIQNGHFFVFEVNLNMTDHFDQYFGELDVPGTTSAVWADLDNDRDFDLVLSCIDHADGEIITTPFVLINEGTGSSRSFRRIQLPLGAYLKTRDIRAVDYDLDGWTDLILIPNDIGNIPRVLHNRGSIELLSFYDVTDEVGNGWSGLEICGVSAADYDKDGDTDLFLGRNRNDLNYYYSSVPIGTTSEHDYIRVRLLDNGANDASAIGARVWIEDPNNAGALLSGLQQIDGGQGRGGQGSPILTFGLGSGHTIVNVCVLWPNGATYSCDHTVNSEVIISDPSDPIIVNNSMMTDVAQYPDQLAWFIKWNTYYAGKPERDRVTIRDPLGDVHIYYAYNLGSYATISGKYPTVTHDYKYLYTPCLEGTYTIKVYTEVDGIVRTKTQYIQMSTCLEPETIP